MPNANSPELLTHLLEMVARGVRSSRGLQEALGVDQRTVRYYLHAGAWLGFLADRDPPVLTSRGLGYVYAGTSRDRHYAEAVTTQPMLALLLARTSGELPDDDSIRSAILTVSPKLAESTVQRRVSAVRGLIAPAVATHEGGSARGTQQLMLPLAQTPTLEPDPPLTRIAGSSFSPDVYRYLLCFLLDYGELTLGHVRGLLDRAGAKDVPIGAYVDLALARQDAVRVDERLVVTSGAVGRRGIVDSTRAVILSDAGWRDHIREIRERLATATTTAPLRVGGPYRRWNERLFGHALRSRTLDADLDAVLRERSLDAFPRTDQVDGAPPVQRQEAFLDVWETPGLAIALPPSLAQLWEGIGAINRRLRNARHRADAVGAPTPAYRPVAVHGGLLHPGEPLPRAVPDTRSLRQRLLLHAPYPALVAALLIAHRRHPNACRLTHTSGGWHVFKGKRRLGELLEILDAFASSQGWLASRRSHGGLSAPVLVSLLQRMGIALVVDDRAVLDDPFFQQLREEEEESQLMVRLDPLSHALVAYLTALPSSP